MSNTARTWLASLLLCVGCGDSSLSPLPTDPPVDVRALTPQVAGQLTPNGYFPQQELAPRPWPQKSHAEAVALAKAFVTTFGPFAATQWSNQHGAPVSPASLRSCGGPLLAESAYEFPEDQPGTALRNVSAAFYLVHFCGPSASPQIVVGVSSAAAALVDAGGGIDLETLAPNSFISLGVPSVVGGPFAISGERAAEEAFRITGRRVAAVPVLELPRFPAAPVYARWRVTLESPRSITGLRSGVTEAVTTVFVGLDDWLLPYAPPRVLRGIELSTASDPLDSLPDISFEPVIYVPVRIIEGRPTTVEPLVAPPE